MFSFVDIRLALLLSAAVLLVGGHSIRDMPVSGCTLEGQQYNEQAEWKPEPCKTCHCNSGMVMCFMAICGIPSGCSNPIVPEGECCPICPDDGTLNCDMMPCGLLYGCSNPIIPEGECCHVCPDVSFSSCTLEGKQYNDKAEWKPEPCTTCICNSGTVVCGSAGCSFPSGCTNPIIPEGECCPICPDVLVGGCTIHGKMFRDKAEWKPDPCKTCHCNSGTVVCDSAGCSFLSGCSNPIVPEGECCPICPDGI